MSDDTTAIFYVNSKRGFKSELIKCNFQLKLIYVMALPKTMTLVYNSREFNETIE